MNTIEQQSIPILIAESNPSLLEALPAVLHEHMPELHLDVCTSHDQAMKNLTTFRYNTVISSVHLAGSDDRFLKRHRDLQSFVPLVITAGASDEESACRALEQGAFDLITSPLDPVQTVTTVRLALWHNKLLRLIDAKEHAIGKYREHMGAYPNDKRMDVLFQRSLAGVNETLGSLQKNLDVVKLMKSSLPDIVTETRAKALERLFALHRKGSGIHEISQPVTTVLMIDDSPDDLKAWSTVLRESFPNYSIRNAMNVREGLDVYLNHKIDCLILDLDLSDSSGFEVLRKLIPDRKHPKIAVIILTRLQNPYLRTQALYYGAQACLVKQFTSARDLDEAIQNAVVSVRSYAN